MLISSDYLKINKQLHSDKALYGTTGCQYADVVERVAQGLGTRDILDYGCGKRTLEWRLGYRIRNYDPAIAGLDAEPQQADIVVCTDVLEHVEPQCLEEVIHKLCGLAKLVAIIVVHTEAAHKHLPDGRNAHLTIQDAAWWRDLLSRYFVLQEIWKPRDSAVAVIGVARSDSIH